MKVHRFSLPEIPSGDQLMITDRRLIHQFCDVLELRRGENIQVFDPTTERQAVIQTIERDHVLLQLGLVLEPLPKLPFEITLAVSLLKGDAWDDIIREVSQLGVNSIIPLVCERTIVRELNQHKLERYQTIAREATELSGGWIIPEIKPSQEFVDWIRQVDPNSTFILDQSGQRLTQIKLPKKVTLAIGPEGGWTSAELKLAASKAVQSISLLPRVLTARLAPAVATAAIICR